MQRRKPAISSVGKPRRPVGEAKKGTSLINVCFLVIFSNACVYFATKQSNANNLESMQYLFGGVGGPNRRSLDVLSNEKSDGFHSISIYSKALKPKMKKTYSQAKQDLVVLALMDANDAKVAKNKETGALRSEINNASDVNRKYFVDLAANDATELSNSYLLEQNGWTGLCLEPNPIYWYRLASYRACTVVGAFVGGAQEDDGKEVNVVLSNGVFGGIAGRGFDNAKKAKEEKRNLVSILTVFQENNVPMMIDYFSLDVEGAETIVMDNFPWEVYKFKFMTIERPKKELKAMLIEHGYRKVVDITDWGETLWIHEESVALDQKEIDSVMDQGSLRCGKWIHSRCEFSHEK